MKPPPGFVHVEASGHLWVRREAAAWAASALEPDRTLHDWAEAREDARALSGRGRVWNVAAPVSGPDGRARWAVRHYRRGGAVAQLLGDRYLAAGTPRPFRELCASEAARDRGIATPAVVAGAVYRAGPFYRADLATELVPGGVDLRELLFGPGEGPDPVQALEATGALVRRMEALGVYHPDLNAANVLLTVDDPMEVWLLDLDRCQVRPEGTPVPVGPMRARLRRSLRKLERGSGSPLAPEIWAALAGGLEEGS